MFAQGTAAMKVDVMIIGAMKCGTTTLADLLKAHPEVDLCKQKEPEFFSKHPDPLAALPDYHALFDPTAKRLHAEASTGYTFLPHFRLDVPDLVHDYNPEVKLIYLVRDPIQRTVSHYMHVYERGYIDLSITEAVRTLPLMVNVSRYATQVKPWIERFGRGSVLILDFADLIKDRAAVLKRVADHLGIDSSGFPPESSVHSNRSIGGNKTHHSFDKPPRWARIGWQLTPRPFRSRLWSNIARSKARPFDVKPELPVEWKRAVMRLVELEVIELEKLMGKDLTAWWTNAGLERER
jgi:hypothetical protein